MQKFDCLVIGGGSGGVRFARIAAQRGAKVAIIEEKYWGGTCVNVGCVPKKLMVYGAAFGSVAETAESYGWNFKKEGFDWQRFQNLRNQEIARLDKIYAANLKKAGVTLFEGHASFVDSKTLEVQPSSLSPSPASSPEKIMLTAPTIIIAVGGEAVRPQIEGAELGLVSDDMFSLASLPKHLAIIGGGYIGLEFSGIAAGYGAKVDLIYRQDLPLRGFDGEVRKLLAKRIPLFGIAAHAGCSPSKIEKTEKGLRLSCDNGFSLETEAVLFATGRRPNLSRLGLENTSVKLSEKGRLVAGSQKCATTQAGIYAIGDVLDSVNLTPFALAQGQTLAEELYPDPEKKRRYWDFEIVPKAVFFSTPVAAVGLSEEEAVLQADLKIFTSEFTPLFASLAPDHLKERERIFIKMIVRAEDDRLLGAVMMGKDSAEIIQVIAACIANKMTKSQLDCVIALHPTTAEELVTLTSEPSFVPQKK